MDSANAARRLLRLVRQRCLSNDWLEPDQLAHKRLLASLCSLVGKGHTTPFLRESCLDTGSCCGSAGANISHHYDRQQAEYDKVVPQE